MKLQLRYMTLSTAYYMLCMVVLTIFLCMEMQSQEHGAEPVYGMGMFTCLTFVVLIGALVKFFVLPDYKAYRPDTTMLLYLAYLFWVFVPVLLNSDEASLMDFVLMLVRTALPVISLMMTFNYVLNHGEQRWMGWFFPFMWLCLAVTYFRMMLSMMDVGDAIQMVSSYYMLFVLPMILLTSGRGRSALFVLLTLFALLTSVKRAGIISMSAGLVVYAVVYFIVSPRLKVSVLAGGVVLLALLVGMFVVVANSDESNLLERFENMQNDEGSGRLTEWSKTYKLLEESESGPLIIGHGYDMVRQDSQTGNSAHNDFLEVTYNYGLIGLVLYVSAFLALVWKTISSVMTRRSFAPVLAMFMTVYFLLSMVSHVIVYEWGNIVLLTIGYIIAKDEMEPDAGHE